MEGESDKCQGIATGTCRDPLLTTVSAEIDIEIFWDWFGYGRVFTRKLPLYDENQRDDRYLSSNPSLPKNGRIMGLLARSSGKLVNNLDSVEEHARDCNRLNANVVLQGHASIFIVILEGWP
jgi:hypothetical protein